MVLAVASIFLKYGSLFEERIVPRGQILETATPVSQLMWKAEFVQILDRWEGSRPGDLDASLIGRFLSDRDEEAFAILVRRHATLVFGTCQRILGNSSDAEDAFQAVFYVLARRATRLKHDRSLGPWLYGVAYRVASKMRGQIVRRRLKEMAVAKSGITESPSKHHDFWIMLDEELAHLTPALRAAVIHCDLQGQSHAEAARLLGVAKGTVTKRLARAHQALAVRLRQRGVGLGLLGIASLLASSRTSLVAALVNQTSRNAVSFSLGQPVGSEAAKSAAESVLRSLKLGTVKVWLGITLLTAMLTGGGFMIAGGPEVPPLKKSETFRTENKGASTKPATMWKENYKVEFPGNLPVSVRFSANGQSLLTGDSNGEVMNLIFTQDDLRWKWKAKAAGSHARAVFSANQKKVYVTTADGVRILNAEQGKLEGLFESKGSNPIALEVFPDSTLGQDPKVTFSKIVFGNAKGYFVKTWAEGTPLDTAGTLETSTLPQGEKPADGMAVPLTVDPQGRSAIMTGPRDSTGKVAGGKDRNVLWAYVCGDYEKDSPGNRVMTGHTAPVVSAAWSRQGNTAITGDTEGRVILWNAKTMKEIRHFELGSRIGALAITDDGTQAAAYVLGKQGEVFVWDPSKPFEEVKPIHRDPNGFNGPTSFASLSFSSDAKRLAGCAGDKAWLNRLGALMGQVRVWDVMPEPAAQLPPKKIYTKELAKEVSSNLVMMHNSSLLTTSSGKEGAVDFRSIAEGQIQFRKVMGKFEIEGVKLSHDRQWIALEQRADNPKGATTIPRFDIGVYRSTLTPQGLIPGCQKLLDIASDDKPVAVVREGRIELWDASTAKKLHTADFKHDQIDAALFSPDGTLLVLAHRHGLIFWHWQAGKHERIDLDHRVSSLAFSTDGKYLAEGPAAGQTVQIRDVLSRKVQITLTSPKNQTMNITDLAFLQGGRVLITYDQTPQPDRNDKPSRIQLWDTASRHIAHEIAMPNASFAHMGVSPNDRYLATLYHEGTSKKLAVWRLDGSDVLEGGGHLPATSIPSK
jgi:RNA polymerase sigma factor (sigma-70 family)